VDVSHPRVLLVAPRDSYRTAPYIEAARRLGIELQLASEGHLAISNPDAPGLRIELNDLPGSVDRLSQAAHARPFVAIVATDDSTLELAAHASARLGLAHNPVEAIRCARRKDLARARLAEAGVRIPRFWRIDLTLPLAPQLQAVRFPVVVKPVALSASRGVVRADDSVGLAAAVARVRPIVAEASNSEERNTLLIEEFIPGAELAVEGLLTGGRLEILAVFDKPDPLDGPFFEETYYVTPSRHPADVLAVLTETVRDACAAYGLREGPIHAECRINPAGVWVLEVAARTIGGLCGRLLRFGTGYGLEELVLQHALGRRPDTHRETGGAGVLMIPIAEAGILRRVEGVLAARRVPHVEEVVIDVREGYELVPLPEGSSYLGFIFARAPSAAAAEAALRAAHAQLRVVVAPLWKVLAS
jgi:biotin carboxylase